MRIDFKNDSQRRCYKVLAERIISPTQYPHFPCLVTLGLRDNVRYMFNQINWDIFSVVKHLTYENVTLEFLSSFPYQPHLGLGKIRGLATFRIFGLDYRLNHRKLVVFLGFQYGPHVILRCLMICKLT